MAEVDWPAEPEPWRVEDRGDVVEVGGQRYPWVFWIVAWAILVPVLWLLGRDGLGAWLRGPGPVLAAFAGLMMWVTMRDLTFLRADREGLEVRTAFVGRFEAIPWDDVVGFRSSKPFRRLPSEEWSVVTSAGREVKLRPVWVDRSPRPYPKLRQIIGGVAQVPTRFGRPPIPFDVPSPPENENTF